MHFRAYYLASTLQLDPIIIYSATIIYFKPHHVLENVFTTNLTGHGKLSMDPLVLPVVARQERVDNVSKGRAGKVGMGVKARGALPLLKGQKDVYDYTQAKHRKAQVDWQPSGLQTENAKSHYLFNVTEAVASMLYACGMLSS